MHFSYAVRQLPYIVFPAFRLQESLRETFGGEQFWKVLSKKLEKKIRERKLIAERENLLVKEKDKKSDEYQRKLDYYEDRVAVMNEEYQREQVHLRSNQANVRIQRRRASDGMIGVQFPLEDYHNDLGEWVERRQQGVEDAF